MRDEEKEDYVRIDEPDAMIATFNNERYVASQSLNERLKKTEETILDFQEQFERDRIYRTYMWIILGVIILFGIAVGIGVMYTKWEVLGMIIKRLLP